MSLFMFGEQISANDVYRDITRLKLLFMSGLASLYYNKLVHEVKSSLVTNHNFFHLKMCLPYPKSLKLNCEHKLCNSNRSLCRPKSAKLKKGVG